VTEEGVDPAVRRQDLLFALVKMVDRGDLVLPERLGDECREHIARVDEGIGWRETDNDYLACAIALGLLRAQAAPVGFM
jgi:hypothetical protein